MEERMVELRDIYKVIVRRKWTIVVATIMFIVMGFIVCFIQSRKQAVIQVPVKEELYKSTASVLITNFPDDKSENIKDITTLNQQIVKTFGAVATSRIVAQKTIDELNLDIKINKFIDRIKVNANADTQIISIYYGNKEEKDVQKITDTYVKIFMVEAKKVYPNAKLEVLDIASKPEKIPADEFYKLNMNQNANKPVEISNTENKGKSKKIIIIEFFFLGIMVGLAVAFAMEFINNSIRKKEEAESILEMPVIGSVDKVVKNGQVNLDESYKILRTALQYKNNKSLKTLNAQDLNNIFMITSPSEGDGKTTTVLKLAEAFAEAGLKTLIIDANGRNPMIHRILNVENSKGLSDILNNFESVNFTQYINKLPKANLYFLSWGISNINPADEFVKGNINEIIKEIKDIFDYVIIDTPSIVKYADAQILLKAVDEVLFIVSEYKTNRDKVIESKKIMDIMNVKGAGICWIGEKKY